MALPAVAMFFIATFSGIIGCAACKSIIDGECQCTDNMCYKHEYEKDIPPDAGVIVDSPKYVVT